MAEVFSQVERFRCGARSQRHRSDVDLSGRTSLENVRTPEHIADCGDDTDFKVRHTNGHVYCENRQLSHLP